MWLGWMLFLVYYLFINKYKWIILIFINLVMEIWFYNKEAAATIFVQAVLEQRKINAVLVFIVTIQIYKQIIV